MVENISTKHKLICPSILVIDKPRGMTSHDVVDEVRNICHIRRVGHAGTLDPLARGVLIVLIGRDATKRQTEFMNHEKEYEAEITFGATSVTMDAEGLLKHTATFEQLARINVDVIQNILPEFIGDILQQVPAYSAVKRNGVPLYRHARAKTLDMTSLPTRTVHISNIILAHVTLATPQLPPSARIRVICDKGTYIRTLCHDIGERLHVGAYCSDLIRTRIGSNTRDNAISLEQFRTHYSQPL